MSKNRRDGIRKSRAERRGRRPELGYYVIVVNTKETENNYFEGLKNSLPSEMQKKLAVVVFKAKTGSVIEVCKKQLSYDPQNRKGWIVFDRDQEVHFDKLIEDAEAEGIGACWSNPCFEIWLHAYYGAMPLVCNSRPEAASQECCRNFGSVYEKYNGHKYSKSEKQLYFNLIKTGNEDTAQKIALERFQNCERDYKGEKFSNWESCTTVFRVIQEIRNKLPIPEANTENRSQ